MHGQGHEVGGHPWAALNGSLPASLLEEFRVEKAVHDHLRSLERHLDAFLVLDQFKKKLKQRASGSYRDENTVANGNTNKTNIKNESDKQTEKFLTDLVENDPDFAETAFRRLMVAEVYRDLERPECIERLNHQTAETGLLIDKLRKEIQLSRNQELDGLKEAKASVNASSYNSKQQTQPSLLKRVLQTTTHPLLKSETAAPWREAVNDGSALKIFIRNYKDNPEKISFRLEGTVNAPLLCILSVLNEVDLFIKWVPYFTTPLKLGLRKVTNEKLGRVDQMVQFHIDFPWPFANRDACFEVFAVDDFERNSQIVVKMLTLDNQNRTPRQRMNIPDPGRSVERVVVDGSLIIKPLTAESSFISLLWHENCRMRVPLMMADFVTKLFARSAFQAFAKTCEEAKEGELKERRKNNVLLYGFVQDRLQEVGLYVPGLHISDEEEDDDVFLDPEEGSE